jgi:DNA-binding transcriptional ArsR family regulator
LDNHLTYKRCLNYLGARVTESSDAVFRAIADPTRRNMLELLRRRERTVQELSAPFAISQPAVSQHLAVLRHAGLVSTRRAGRNRVYRLEPASLEAVDDWVEHYRHFWRDPETKRRLR